MKIIKKNQLVILVISLILMTAGYLNFTNEKNTTQTSNIIAELGDATLVSSNVVKTNIDNTVEDATQENIISQNAVVENNIENNIKTSNQIEKSIEAAQEDNYFIKSKLERENIYSQMLETYQEIYNNVNSTPEQKNNAIEKIGEINETKNAIMIAENLVQAKGFEDIVIFSNSNSVSVIVKTEELKPEQIAQIQNIVSRELEVGAEVINISTK